jgi:hypothetical protein
VEDDKDKDADRLFVDGDGDSWWRRNLWELGSRHSYLRIYIYVCVCVCVCVCIHIYMYTYTFIHIILIYTYM